MMSAFPLVIKFKKSYCVLSENYVRYTSASKSEVSIKINLKTEVDFCESR
ncbi:Uncharacterised protein [Mycobacteroides abscessus subsp. abscessus]|nr:Uncharacterised protein [Mycobacteroides abscessus subsp. abscessus]